MSSTRGSGSLLHHPEPTNALTRQAYRELISAAAELAERADIARSSCSADTRSSPPATTSPNCARSTAPRPQAADRVRRDAIDAVAAIPKPTVAAITGYALGSGLSLALAADWRISGDNVKFGATEILAGLVPGGGGCQRLARAVGARQPRNWPSAAASSTPRRPWRWDWSTNWWPPTTSSTPPRPGRAGSSTPRRRRWRVPKR